jgi:hypothetical protein
MFMARGDVWSASGAARGASISAPSLAATRTITDKLTSAAAPASSQAKRMQEPAEQAVIE